MSVEFIKEKESFRWLVKEGLEDGEDEAVHECHKSFRSPSEAFANLLNNHAIMGIFVAHTAMGGSHDDYGQVSFIGVDSKDKAVRWLIRGPDGIIGESYFSFDDLYSAADNLIITYTLLTMFISQSAQAQMSDK